MIVLKKIIKIMVVFVIIVMMGYVYSSKYSLFGLRTFTVASNSMSPDLVKDDLIITIVKDKYQVGDIITRKDNNIYITHRIISIDDKYVTTKGDANDASDEKDSVNKIVGKVIVYIPSNLLWILRIISIIIIVILLFI